MKDREAELQRQVNSLSQQLTLKDSELIRSQGKADTLQAYVKTLEAEIQESRNKIGALNDQLHSGESTTIQQEHKKNQQEIQLYDLKQQIASQRDEVKQLQSDLSLAQKDSSEWH